MPGFQEMEPFPPFDSARLRRPEGLAASCRALLSALGGADAADWPHFAPYVGGGGVGYGGLCVMASQVHLQHVYAGGLGG